MAKMKGAIFAVAILCEIVGFSGAAVAAFADSAQLVEKQLIRRDKACTPSHGWIAFRSGFLCVVACKPGEIGVIAWYKGRNLQTSEDFGGGQVPDYGTTFTNWD